MGEKGEVFEDVAEKHVIIICCIPFRFAAIV